MLNCFYKNWTLYSPNESIWSLIAVAVDALAVVDSELLFFGSVWVEFILGSVFTWVNEKVTVFDVFDGIEVVFPKFGTFSVPVLELIIWLPEPEVGTEVVIELELVCEAFITGFLLSSLILDVRLVWCKNCCWGRTATGFWTIVDDNEADDGLLGGGVGGVDWVAAIRFAIFSETIAEFLRFKVWICCVCCCFGVEFFAFAAFAAYSPSTSDETPVWIRI